MACAISLAMWVQKCSRVSALSVFVMKATSGRATLAGINSCLDKSSQKGNTNMFHAFDNDGPNHPLQRPQWMALLARAPQPLLERAVGQHLAATGDAAVHWLRRPEVGLMMVQGR